MIESLLPTGQWTGFYLESHTVQRGWMHLYLEFVDGLVKGEGTDRVGPWTLQGTYGHASPTESDGSIGCQWIKQYVGQHQVVYEGLVSKEGIIGEWNIRDFNKGRFHVWPATRGDLNELYLNEDLELESRPSTQFLGTVDNDPFLA